MKKWTVPTRTPSLIPSQQLIICPLYLVTLRPNPFSEGQVSTTDTESISLPEESKCHALSLHQSYPTRRYYSEPPWHLIYRISRKVSGWRNNNIYYKYFVVDPAVSDRLCTGQYCSVFGIDVGTG